MPESSNKPLIIGIIAATVVIFGGLVWAVLKAPSEQEALSSGTIETGLTFDDALSSKDGVKGSPVVVHIEGDFQCPACRSAEPGLEYARTKYHEKNVLFVWKDLPLTTIHKNARNGANAARCAQDQGWFWSFKNKLYEHQPEWSELADPSSAFISYAKEIEKEKGVKLNEQKFADCLQAKTFDNLVGADIAEGLKNRVDQTPTYIVNNRRYFGMGPAAWDKAIELAFSELPASANVTSTATTSTTK